MTDTAAFDRTARLGALTPIPLANVRFTDAFWAPRLETNRAVTLPLEYEQNRRNRVLEAYQWDWRDESSLPGAPWRIIVGDLGKWIEAASHSLATRPDAELAQRVEQAIQAMLAGQKEDGYLYPNPMRRDHRWANLQEYHELYELGHDIEAAVAHHEATGQRHFLDAVCKAADQVAAAFGWEQSQRRGYDGHPEIELALVKLYRATGERRYLELAKFFVDVRGTQPHYFEREAEELKARGLPTFGWYKDARRYWLCQAHRPLREQDEAAGHAVRALYLYSGAADVASETGDAELLEVCRRLWRSVMRRMYITGGAGSSPSGEAFSFDFDLPNETGYAETCANIALVFFAHRMLRIEADAQYADAMERALYNGVLSGISLDGRRFFYANHLTVYPSASVGAHGHVAAQRQEWFPCACCPPNIARLLASLGRYAYSTGESSVYVHLYAGGEASCEVNGNRVRIRQETQYPWGETVKIAVEPAEPARFTLALRLPGWCRRPRVRVNGRAVGLNRITRRGYAHILRLWRPDDVVELTLPMPIERIEANPRVRMDCGKVALQRGPVVYCLEETDNGKELADLFLPRAAKLTAECRPDLLGGCVVLRGKAKRRAAAWADTLYRAARSNTRDVELLAVPYALWANREPGEMIVWLREA